MTVTTVCMEASPSSFPSLLIPSVPFSQSSFRVQLHLLFLDLPGQRLPPSVCTEGIFMVVPGPQLFLVPSTPVPGGGG